LVTDSIVPIADSELSSFAVRRQIQVVSESSTEAGFSTRFSLQASSSVPREFFMPAIWYRGSPALAPAGSIAGDPDAEHILVREDRLPLPLVMAWATKGSMSAAELVHVRPDGSTFLGENHRARLIDERMLFGSLGVVREPGLLSLAFQFPGSEGDRTYIDGRSAGWAKRAHPLRSGFAAHTFELRFTVTPHVASYDESLKRTWRRAFAEAAPSPPPADGEAVWRVSMDLLSRVAQEYHGVPSMPFRVDLASGLVDDTSSQMGFVGMALPAAALLLRDAIDREDAPCQARAEAIIDFWAAECELASTATTGAVPATWFNISDDGSTAFRPSDAYQGHVRIMCEGMAGMLAAHALVPTKDAWLRCAQRYGDFLLSVQNADGSVPMSWRLDGTPYDATLLNATHMVIPFLVALFRATQQPQYQAAAILAGRFSAASLADGRYVGGACDNNNVPDKEAAVLALIAFVELYDLTRDATWLAPAARAATYAETFTYAWSVPLLAGAGVVYPHQRNSLGVSIIALGQSGADNFMARAVELYRRLGTLLDDEHFGTFGAFLDGATKQVLDWDGKLGYPQRGLMNEAITLVCPRGSGVAKWLPWLSVTLLEPMASARAERSSVGDDERAAAAKKERAEAERIAIRTNHPCNHLEMTMPRLNPNVPSAAAMPAELAPLAARAREAYVRSDQPMPGEGEAAVELDPDAQAAAALPEVPHLGEAMGGLRLEADEALEPEQPQQPLPAELDSDEEEEMEAKDQDGAEEGAR